MNITLRQEILGGLQYLFLSGEEMPRGDKYLLGISNRGATDALGALLKATRRRQSALSFAETYAALYVPAAVA